MSNRSTVKCFTDERNISSFDISNNKNFLLSKEMKRELIYRITKDGFLDKDNISTTFDDFDNHFSDVLFLFSKDSINILMSFN